MPLRILSLIAFLLLSAAANAYELNSSKWPQPSTTMYLGDLNGTSSNGASWRSAFNEAADSWSDNSNFNFSFSNSQVPDCSQVDTRNYIGFSSSVCDDAWGGATLAVTMSASFSDGTLAKSDILFNSHLSWDVHHGASSNPHDFRRVAVHELGHALGLGHEGSAVAIMAPIEGSIETPTTDDLNGVTALYGSPPTSLAPIVLRLESPAPSDPAVGVSVLSGISNIQGWVVSQAAIRRVEFYVDNVFIANVPFGGSRGEVGRAFPQYPNSVNSGFSMAWNYALFSPGTHTARVRAIDVNGNTQEILRNFSTVEFNNTEFFPDSNKINLRNATAEFPPADVLSYQMIIRNAIVDNRSYSILLLWNRSSQKFEISNVSPN